MNINYDSPFNFKPIPSITPASSYWQNSTWKFNMPEITVDTGVSPSWVDVILHGTTALTLVNAKEGSLEYLKLYGDTEQLPETYLDTVTASGKCEQRNLPSGFTQVEYLEVATGNAYFSTGINATIDTDMRITASNITSSSSQILVAQCESGSDYFRIAKAGASQRIIGSFGSSTVTDNNTDGASKFTARMNKSGFYVNGSLIGTFSNIPSSLTDVGEIDIFRGKYSNTSYYAYAGSRFHSAWVDDNIFLPCRRNSDNKLGIYNTKTGEFILPGGSGTFTAGADLVPTPSTPMDIICNNGVLKFGENIVDNTIDGTGTFISPSSVTTRIYKVLGKLPSGNYKLTITGNFEFIVQYKDAMTNPTASGNIGSWSTSGEYTLNNPDYYYGIAIRYPNNTTISPSNFNGTISLQPLYIHTDGTQEVVTDSLGNTASAEMLLSVGDYKDTQEVLTGTVSRNVGVLVLDGTEDATVLDSYPYGTNSFSIKKNPIAGAVSSSAILTFCTHFKSVSFDVRTTASGQICYVDTPTNTTSTKPIILRNTEFASLATFKAFLQNEYSKGTPVMFVFPLGNTSTTESVSAQFLSKSPVEQTSGSISNLPIAITESQKTVPTPTQPLDINCNNGVAKVLRNMWNMNSPNMSKSVPGFNLSSATISSDGIFTVTNNSGNSASRVVLTFTAANLGLVDGKRYTLKVWSVGDNDFQSSRSNTIIVNGSPYVFAQASPITFTWTQTGGNGVQIGAIYFENYAVGDTASICVQISEGETIGDYLPYGQSQIYTDGTTETVEITGKNLWSNDITFISGSLSATTGQPSASSISHYTSAIPVKIGETYTFSLLDGVESGTLQSYKRIIGYSSANITDFVEQLVFIDMTGKQGQKGFATITIPANVNYIRVSCGLIDSEYQLEQGSTATTYEPYYNGGTATAENLFKVGTYQDVQSVLDGGVTRNVGVKVLDGSEEWNTDVYGAYRRFYIANFGKSGLSNVFCTHYDSNVITVAKYNNCYLSLTGALAITISAEQTFTTVEQWKQFLAQQYANGTPVIVVYPATPTTETVTAQPMNIQAGTNIVQITQASMDDLELEVKYKAGVAVTITEIENAQLDDNVEVTING